jgi:hypothetical protein
MSKTEIIGVIKGTTKCAMGHQPHTTGSGAHKDSRTKRQRTRADKKRKAIKEYT